MRFGEKAVASLLRPVYRLFLEKPIWWFLSKVKAFFLAEAGVRLERLEEMQSQLLNRSAQIEERLLAMEAANSAQWNAIEELLLVLLRHPNS